MALSIKRANLNGTGTRVKLPSPLGIRRRSQKRFPALSDACDLLDLYKYGRRSGILGERQVAGLTDHQLTFSDQDEVRRRRPPPPGVDRCYRVTVPKTSGHRGCDVLGRLPPDWK